jgi:transcriptional regulator with XRE-family HTH domain
MTSYLRYHRKKSGLTQREVAEAIGSIGARQVARHESAKDIPTLRTAMGYQILFRASTPELFPSAFRAVSVDVEQRLRQIEERLHQSTAKGRKAAEIAHKLEWFVQRRHPEI